MKKNTGKAAGVLIISRGTGRFFLMKRSQGVNPGAWAIPSGMIEDGETPLEGLKREMGEETQINPEIIDYYYSDTEKNHGKDFFYYLGFTDKEFAPILNDENSEYGWFDKNNLPSPLYPELDKKIAKI